ncbi:hypothetical protein ACTMU2_31635 [Cupriavidus basilensis]
MADVNAAFGVNLLDYTQAQMGSFHARTQEVVGACGSAGRYHRRVRPEQSCGVDPRGRACPPARRASLAQARRPWFRSRRAGPGLRFPGRRCAWPMYRPA